MTSDLHIGTCSWKYDAWRGLVYDRDTSNFLQAYARRYPCVEVDQWFWSLFGPDKVVLPTPAQVRQYAESVPPEFRFGVKLPNALTMTHCPASRRGGLAVENPHFLSPPLLDQFMERLEPLRDRLGPLMLQFGYLNKQKMPSQQAFLDRLASFAARLPTGLCWCVESRNPNYLNTRYFQSLRAHDLHHVFLQGYYMPSVFELYARHADALTGTSVIRLHGPDREGIEEKTGSRWDEIVAPRDADLDALAVLLQDLRRRGRKAWVFVNNHFEGCAPKTITRLESRLAGRGERPSEPQPANGHVLKPDP